MKAAGHALSARPPAFDAGRRAGVSDNRLGRQAAGDLRSRWPRHHRAFPNSRRSRSRNIIPRANRRNSRKSSIATNGASPPVTIRCDRSYLIALGDDAGTKLYVSSRSGEIALDIQPHRTRLELARLDPALDLSDRAAQGWPAVAAGDPVVSGICLIVGVTGIWIGILRVRLKHAMRAADHALSRLDGMAPRHRPDRRHLRADLDVLRLAFAQSRRIFRGPQHDARGAATLCRP